MVLEGWRHAPIKLLCESIIDCVNKTAPVVDYETPYKMIRTTNVRHGKVDTDNVRYVEAETYKNWVRRGAPRKGDLIFTREAPVGEAGILDSDDSVFLGQRTMMYRADPSKSNNLFLFYSLQTSFCRKQIEDLSNGGTVAHMRVPDCGEIIIRVPPVPEQRKITQILSTWDQAIEVTEKLLSNSQQQKKSLMQQLLTGRKRFPGFSGEWTHRRLDDVVFEFIVPMRDKPKSLVGDIPWCRIEDFDGIYLKNSKSGQGVNSQTVKEMNLKICPIDTLLVSCSADLGRCAIVKEPLVTNQTFIGLVPRKEKLDILFLYYVMSVSAYKLNSLSSGTTISYLSRKEFEKFRIELPELKEQQKIALVLSAADKEIEAFQQKLDCLKQEKKALMEQLLTGKRRVKVDEEEISQKEAARA